MRWARPMRILALRIRGFRGIQEADLAFPGQVALVGPNGSGKSTVVDALSLVFGRDQLVRELTEHDFTGSRPQPETRIQIVATLGGFPSNDPSDHPNWFQHGRAIEKWWNPTSGEVDPEPTNEDSELCVQVGYSARFDQDELQVEQIRYFHDDDEILDPFMEDAVTIVPAKLLREVGFYVLPTLRTWPSMVSFGSELFRRAVSTLGAVPASSVLTHLDSLRNPEAPLEDDPALQPLINNINMRMAQLLPAKPKLKLRLTSTDSKSLLSSLVPHYELDIGGSLPAGRQGTGLLSLQTLILLLEIGRARMEAGLSFILALEEPELHVPPGLQRRIIGEAAAVSNQVICTTHAPRVAAFFDASRIQVLTKVAVRPAKRPVPDSNLDAGSDEVQPVLRLEGKTLAPASMMKAPNPLIQLFTEDRTRLVEALMFPCVLVPEGRIDYEWLRHLLDVSETGRRTGGRVVASIAPFGAVVGVVPTRSAAVKVTYERIRSLHPNVLVLVDGDSAGDGYVRDLLKLGLPPSTIVQWPKGWTIEDLVGWVIEEDEPAVLTEVCDRLERPYDSTADLVAEMKIPGRDGGLKDHYMAHEDIAGAIKKSPACVRRAELLLEALTRAALHSHGTFEHLILDASLSCEEAHVYRFHP